MKIVRPSTAPLHFVPGRARGEEGWLRGSFIVDGIKKRASSRACRGTHGGIPSDMRLPPCRKALIIRRGLPFPQSPLPQGYSLALDVRRASLDFARPFVKLRRGIFLNAITYFSSPRAERSVVEGRRMLVQRSNPITGLPPRYFPVAFRSSKPFFSWLYCAQPQLSAATPWRVASSDSSAIS